MEFLQPLTCCNTRLLVSLVTSSGERKVIVSTYNRFKKLIVSIGIASKKEFVNEANYIISFQFSIITTNVVFIFKDSPFERLSVTCFNESPFLLYIFRNRLVPGDLVT